MSSYLITRNPFRFGDKQQDYNARVDFTVKETADTFKRALESKSDLQKLFHETLASLGEIRHRIALDHQTKDGDLFGVRRDQDPFPGTVGVTPLGGEYKEYNPYLWRIVKSHLAKMGFSADGFQQTESASEGENSKIEIKVISFKDKKWFFLKDLQEEYKRISNLINFPHSPESPITKNRAAMRKLKETFPDDYKRLHTGKAILEIAQFHLMELPKQKFDWLHVTLHSQVGQEMRPLSEFITWIKYEDRVTETMFSIVHQDPFLIDSMLTDIARIFEEVISWNGENLKELKDLVALLQYELAHVMPFKRGSSAVSEWLERAIYLLHGFNLKYHQKKMVNLEALTTLLNEFIENYDSMIGLERAL